MTIFGFDIGDFVSSTSLIIAFQILLTIVAREIERRRRENKVINFVFWLVGAFVAFYFTVNKLVNPEDMSVLGVSAIFAGFTTLWGVVFHVAARDFGWWVTAVLRGVWWVKGIDYVYLVLSFLGLLRVVLGTLENAPPTPEMKLAFIISVLMIGVGVALRITKTSIEIFGWERARGQTSR